MGSRELNKLIDGLLEKGHLTDSERKLLFKEAAEEGINSDDFENYLDSKIKERYSTNPANRIKKDSKTILSNIEEFLYLDYFRGFGILGIILWVILLPLILLWKAICILFNSLLNM